MYSKKFGNLMLGLVCTRPKANVKNVLQLKSPSGRSVFSWSSVCKHRTQLLQRTTCVDVHQNALHCHVSVRSASQTTVDPNELKRFQSLASKWWDERGEFAALHAMNDLRVPFIRDNLFNVHGGKPGNPLAGLKILDVGCGGGLLTEPLGRLGARVLGIDPVEDSIGTARLHSSRDPDLLDRVQYQACTLEDLTGEGEEDDEFDAVVASEVVEHLADLETFTYCCSHVLKPGGSLFITTINKTNLSYALAIVAAEQLLRIVPMGTHDWEKFVSPEELERLLESNGFSVQSVRGMLYNPVSGEWSWTDSTAINYALHAVKLSEEPQTDTAEADRPDPQHQAAATHH